MATQEDGRFYLQRSSCSIEITYESESEINVAVLWHTGARLLGHGNKSWQTSSLKEAAQQLREFAPNADVPYDACVAELVTHIPPLTSGRALTYSPSQTPRLPAGNHDHPTVDRSVEYEKGPND